MESKAEEKHRELDSKDHQETNLKGDYCNVLVLTLLYLLQGIPVGITYAIPFLLHQKGVSYGDQAAYSFAFYPMTKTLSSYIVKILWAPIVDSVYIKSFGRRKSWLIPSQLLIGVFMLYMSYNVDEWFGDGIAIKPKILLLAVMFFILFFFTTTQDVVVDGWALTMLQRRNVAYAATSNQVGQTIGICISVVALIILESKQLVTFAGYLKACGVTFILVTFFIAIFKHENSREDKAPKDQQDYGIRNAYLALWKIMKLKSVWKLAAFIVSMNICIAASESVGPLKLIDYGMPKEKLAAVGFVRIPVMILVPIIFCRKTAGKFPMTIYMRAFPFRMLAVLAKSCFVLWIFLTKGNDVSRSQYLVLTLLSIIYHTPASLMNVSETSFFTQISDPLVGGTYMTLLNTVSNLGVTATNTLFLWLVDLLTWKSCDSHQDNFSLNSTNLNCSGNATNEGCVRPGGDCTTHIDGFFIEIAIGIIFSFFWYNIGRKVIEKLQRKPIETWHVLTQKSSENQTEI